MPSVQEIFPADAPSGTASHVPPDWQTQKAEGHLVDEALIRAENEDKMIPYLAYLISSAALGGFLYGYDTGVIGQEIATAATTFGSIFGASILGMFADKWGRKPCLLISDLFFTAGAIVIAFSFSLAQLIVGRLILGVGLLVDDVSEQMAFVFLLGRPSPSPSSRRWPHILGVKKSKQMRKEKEGMQREMKQEGALVNEYQVAEIVKEHGAVHLENLSVGPKV
ncbi:hypothetical protein JADG_007553 [Aureobasidium aubasidani]|nr:hypothetical protein JADG_007553 [Aureobasidium pullulans]